MGKRLIESLRDHITACDQLYPVSTHSVALVRHGCSIAQSSVFSTHS